MNCANLAVMNGQQAPTGRPTVSARQSTRLDPSQTASMNRNLIVGQTRAARISALTTRRDGVENAAEQSLLQPGQRADTPDRRRLRWRDQLLADEGSLIAASPLRHPHTGVVEVHRALVSERDQRDRPPW